MSEDTEKDFLKIIRECTALYDEMFPGENMQEADDSDLVDFDPYHAIQSAMMALNFYQSCRSQSGYSLNWVQPDYVPKTIYADTGRHEVARYNKWGAISIVGSDGKLLGLRPHEYRVLSWQERKPEE